MNHERMSEKPFNRGSEKRDPFSESGGLGHRTTILEVYTLTVAWSVSKGTQEPQNINAHISIYTYICICKDIYIYIYIHEDDFQKPR